MVTSSYFYSGCIDSTIDVNQHIKEVKSSDRGYTGNWGFCFTASWIWVSSVLWQPKGPPVTWGASSTALVASWKKWLFNSTLHSAQVFFVQFGALQDKKDIKLLAYRARATNMVKGIKGKTYEEWLCSHGLFSLEKRRVRRDSKFTTVNLWIRSIIGHS